MPILARVVQLVKVLENYQGYDSNRACTPIIRVVPSANVRTVCCPFAPSVIRFYCSSK